jgi:hypothetical protein
MKFLARIFLLIFAFPGILFAQEKIKLVSGDTIAIVESTLRKVSKNVNFTVIPGPTYNASQKLGFAVLPMIVYNLNKSDSVSPPSSTAALIYFDFNGSWFTAAKQNFYWNQNKWRAIAFAGYGHLHSRFYGIGRDTAIIEYQNEDYVWMVDKPFTASLTCYRRIIPGLYIGLEYHYANGYIEGKDSLATAEMKQKEFPTGAYSEGILIPSLIWDTRNNIFWSTKGYYASLTFNFANTFLLSSENFGKFSGFISGYHRLIPGSTRLSLAWRFFYQRGWDDIPYTQMANYGKGDEVMGYTGGKYVNYSETNAQAELRYDVWKFISVSGFAGIGKIFEEPASFGQSIWLPFGGLNVYLNVIPYRNIRARGGFAAGKGDFGFYVGMSQMF